MKIEVEFYDANGTIVGSDSDDLRAVGAKSEIAVEMWSTPEAFDKDGNLVQHYQAAGNEYGIRYVEALCMEAAYQRRKNKILENRISELEKQVSDMLQILQNLTSNNG